MMNRLPVYVSVGACLLASSVWADTITLKPSVRLASHKDVITLADIANLDGAEAAGFAGLEILRGPFDAVREISVLDVRARLDEAGAHWGHINLSGRAVILRPAHPSQAAAPLAMTPIALEPETSPHPQPQPSRQEHIAGTLINSPTLRGLLANLIVANLHIQPDDLRLGFDAADSALLDTPFSAARFEVQPLSSFASDRIDLTVRTWSQGKVQQTMTIGVTPHQRVQAAVLRHDVPRDQTITEGDIEVSPQWLPPSQAGQTRHHIAAVGCIAARNLKAGDVLRESHLRRQTLIKRGDLVVVRCLVGGVAISLQAEARADGSEGDQIEFRKQGERETFLATVAARGEAVVDLSKR